MDEFELKSEKEISVLFHSPEIKEDGWLAFYSITISARAMKATIRVENAPYASNPVEFFETVSVEWKGWDGEKKWDAIEGDFRLSATSDSTGHIELTIALQPSYYAPCWSSEVTLVLEAGQLEKICKTARAFFYPASNNMALKRKQNSWLVSLRPQYSQLFCSA